MDAYISGVFPAWVVIDEFHLLKSMSKNAGPWEYIMDIRKLAKDIPAVIAMSGTPVSVGHFTRRRILMSTRFAPTFRVMHSRFATQLAIRYLGHL